MYLAKFMTYYEIHRMHREGHSISHISKHLVLDRRTVSKYLSMSEQDYEDLYNLGFGDKNVDTGEIDDNTISNNGDSEKVLATVVVTLYAFTDKHIL